MSERVPAIGRGHNGGPQLDDPSPPVDKSRLLSLAEATVYLGVSKTKFYELLADGDLPWVRIGDRRLFRPSDLNAFIEARVERAASKSVQSRAPPAGIKPRPKSKPVGNSSEKGKARRP